MIPDCKTVFISRSFDNIIDFIDDGLPMLEFGELIDFFVHEKLSNKRYLDESGKGLDDWMGLVVVYVG